MATLISGAPGNYTTANTWRTVDTTSLLDGSAQSAEAGNTALTTSAVASSAFTPGAITLDGIALHIASVAGAVGTITVALETGGSAVAATQVTQNIATLPPCTTGNNEGGWVLFAFTPVTLLAATAYKVRALVSAGASAVNLYRDGTAGNWARMLRQSTNVGAAAPTTGDVLYVMGQCTGGAGTTSYTVTMDGTSTNQLGGVSICKYGTLAYGTSGGQSYYLKTIGNQASTPGVIVYSGGTLTMGTSGSALDSTSTAVLELNAGSDGQYGLTVKNGATLTTQGATVTTIATKLAADVAANAASFTTSVSTGWVSGDVVAIASTTRTAGDTEQITLGTVTGTACNVSVGGGTGANTLKNAHSGTGATAGEVVHLTRNVKIRNASSSFGAYVDLKGTSTVSCAYTEFSTLGANVATQRGIEIETTTGTCTLDHCAVHDTRNYGLRLQTSTGSVSITSCVLYNCNTVNAASTGPVYWSPTSGAHTFSGNFVIGGAANGNGLLDSDSPASSVSANTVAGGTSATAGINLRSGTTLGTFSGNVVHSCSGPGLVITASIGLVGTLASCTLWRNNGTGLVVGSGQERLVYTSCTIFGQTTNVSLATGEHIFTSPALQGDASFATTTGISLGASCRLAIYSGSLGSTTSQGTDLSSGGTTQATEVLCWNTLLSSATDVSLTGSTDQCCVRSHKHNQSATTFKSYYRRGTVQSDQTIRHTASGYAYKATPTSSTYPLRVPGPTGLDTFRVPMTNGQSCALGVWLYRTSDFVGTAQIVIVGGVLGGVGSAGSDIVTPISIAATTWTQVTCATQVCTEDGALEWRLELLGTAGSMYLDDVALA